VKRILSSALLALAAAGRDLVAVYLPVGGTVHLALPAGQARTSRWFDPRTGELTLAQPNASQPFLSFISPAGGETHPFDWVLLLTAQ
jgi:hypothetical protein